MAHSVDFDLNDSEDELLNTCGVCFEYYDEKERVPKFLKCHHSFCLLCLKQIVSKLNTIACPNCREQTTVKGRVELLPTNPYTLQFATLARKKQLEIKEAKPIIWCVRCGGPANDECSGQHLVLNIEAKERKNYSKLSKYVTECKERWMESVMERRALNSTLESVVSSLNVVKEKVAALIEDNSSQAAVMESLIDEVELFGINPGEQFNLTGSLENFERAADYSRTLLTETKNLSAELNCLDDWSLSFTNKLISQLAAVPFHPSIDTNDPFSTTATFALSLLLPKLLKDSSKQPSSSSSNNRATSENNTEAQQGGRFVEVGTANQPKKRADSFAVAVANGPSEVPKPLGYRRSSCCFFDVEANGKALGRVIILLETDYAHKMCKVFSAGCRPGNKMSYRGTTFFQTCKDDYINGGSNDETGIETLYVPDKSTLKDERGAIRMRRRDQRDKQVLVGTEFSIILSKGPYRQYPFTTVFGRVVEGLDICDQISALNPYKNRIVIGECGQL